MRTERVLIMGAAGRDFHDFNVVYRGEPGVEVVAFTATQIPGIADRRYPPELAGERYPAGVPAVQYAQTQHHSGAVVRCESKSGGYRECYSGFRHPPTLVRQLSDSGCREGSSWGHRPGMLRPPTNRSARPSPSKSAAVTAIVLSPSRGKISNEAGTNPPRPLPR